MCHSATEALLKEVLQFENINMGVKLEYDQVNKWCDNKATEFCDTTLLVTSIWHHFTNSNGFLLENRK